MRKVLAAAIGSCRFLVGLALLGAALAFPPSSAASAADFTPGAPGSDTLLPPTPAAANICGLELQPEPPIRGTLLDQGGGATRAAALYSHFLVTHTGPRLLVYDLTGGGLRLIARDLLLTGVPSEIAISSHYAIIAAGSLLAIDLADPAAPVLVGHLEPAASISRVVVRGRYAYVGDSYAAIRIIDINDPMRMVEVGRNETIGSARAIAVENGRLYLADPEAGLRIFDITNPAQPHEIGFFAAISSMSLALRDRWLYLGASPWIYVLDVSDSTQPRMVSKLYARWWLEDMRLSGSRLFVARSLPSDPRPPLGAVLSVDVSVPSAPVIASTFSTSGTPLRLALQDDMLYVAEATALRVLNLGASAGLQEVAYLPTWGSDARRITERNGLMYLSDGRQGLTIVDIRQPASSRWLSTLPLPGNVRDTAVSGNYAYVAAGGLRVIDVTRPDSPTEVSGWTDDGLNIGLATAISGTTAYYAQQYKDDFMQQNGRLELIDVADPAHPKELKYVASSSHPATLVLTGTLLIHSATWTTLYDVAAPLQIHELARENSGTAGVDYDIAMRGAMTYIAQGACGLRSSRFDPKWWWGRDQEILLPGTTEAVDVAGHYVYLGDSADLQVVEHANPPYGPLQRWGRFPVAGYIYDVAVRGNYVYLSAGPAGLFTLWLAPPTSLWLYGRAATLSK